ncbi:hypothetical protein CRYUN_Cryun12cG0097500 [Craigia yunnanensis]
MLPFVQVSKNLILQTLLSLSLTLILTFLKIPIFFLRGLHTYIHPENVGHGNNASSDKFEFDENNAQIFRLKLDEGHLQTRPFFNEYNNSFVFSFVVFLALEKISFEKSASKRSEKQFSAILGVVGFLIGIMICSGIGPAVFDFHFDSVEESWRIFVAVLMGFLAGFLYMPAEKNARIVMLTALLWINPLTEILVNKNSYDGRGAAEKLVGNMFLNEAVLSWYQRLHASMVPDLDFSYAKIDSNSFDKYNLVCGLLPCSAFVKEVALFMAWWIIFVWAVITSASLVFCRRGILYVS